MPDEIATAPAPAPTPAPTAPPDWRPFLTDDLKADPVVSGWAEKASEKDIPALVKSYAHLSKRMGSAINLPGKDAKPEDVQALRAKLYEAGVFTAPPADPKDYGLTSPETLPDGLRWNDELAGKFASALHKHGVPKAAMADLLPLYIEALGGSTQAFKIDREKSMAALRAEHGEKFDERMEMVRRMADGIFTDPEEVRVFEESGLGDHEKFLSVMMRLAPLAMQDNSFIESIPTKGGEMAPEAAREEANKVYFDPSHPLNAAYKLNPRDPKVEAYISGLYRKAYGNEKVNISDGVGASR